MKLFRFGAPGEERPGIFHKGQRLDLSGFSEDYNENFFASGGMKRLKAFVRKNLSGLTAIPSDARLGPAVCRPSKIICIGLNYIDHAHETNSPIPKEPIVFFKSTTSICGPDDSLVIPRNSTKTDWEVELAVVIGKKARYVEEQDAMGHISGYLLHNDYSERAFQLERGGQWVKGKSCDTFAPLGPYLVTPDEVADVHNLPLWLKVNGQLMQNSSTRKLIFRIPFLVHYLSQFMTLLPGDIISTGTPPGVGMGRSPQQFLKAGDVVESGIGDWGTAKQVVTSFQHSDQKR